ncbi:hypothetical protein, partial [Clostridioides difficile]|uniref:hypothetical protein n=1 Tax=Clostridioides difficile TaxID=1496 RepID=UPI001A9A3CDF
QKERRGNWGENSRRRKKNRKERRQEKSNRKKEEKGKKEWKEKCDVKRKGEQRELNIGRRRRRQRGIRDRKKILKMDMN